jgi:hypothetical protein
MDGLTESYFSVEWNLFFGGSRLWKDAATAQGSMLWSQFSAIFINFSAKKIGVFLKDQCYDQNFA